MTIISFEHWHTAHYSQYWREQVCGCFIFFISQFCFENAFFLL